MMNLRPVIPNRPRRQRAPRGMKGRGILLRQLLRGRPIVINPNMYGGCLKCIKKKRRRRRVSFRRRRR